MEIEFDPAKDAVNVAKHGVSLRIGWFVLMQQIGAEEDTRQIYGEQRFNAFGPGQSGEEVRDKRLKC